MSLEKKDLRVYLDSDLHAGLAVLADVDRLELKDLAEQMIRECVQRRVHEATVIAEKTKRLGLSRISRGSAGIDRNATE